jgi:hypothetical protein
MQAFLPRAPPYPPGCRVRPDTFDSRDPERSGNGLSSFQAVQRRVA